jgi:hypothetical protein
MVLIVCIITGIATAALMSWLQPAPERWAARPAPIDDDGTGQCQAEPRPTAPRAVPI